ncbi:MAG: hypothetical protein RL617_590 [Pseudomonadota bacterium]|jgi:hypothetical protein
MHDDRRRSRTKAPLMLVMAIVFLAGFLTAVALRSLG